MFVGPGQLSGLIGSGTQVGSTTQIGLFTSAEHLELWKVSVPSTCLPVCDKNPACFVIGGFETFVFVSKNCQFPVSGPLPGLGVLLELLLPQPANIPAQTRTNTTAIFVLNCMFAIVFNAGLGSPSAPMSAGLLREALSSAKLPDQSDGPTED